MPRRPAPITLSAEERTELDRLIRAGSTPQQTALRARMIVMAADGVGIGETAQVLGVWRKGVGRQRTRWLVQAHAPISVRLSDAPRRQPSPPSRPAPLWPWPARHRRRAVSRSATGAPVTWRAK